MKLKQVLKKINGTSPPPQGGYTIMESLVAMVIVAVLMSAVAPVIVLSVGMRVQARRIELGAQAARSYIDAVRSEGLLPPSGFTNEVDIPASALADAGCSAGLTYCPDNTVVNVAYGEFYCVDNDGDDVCTKGSLTDMMVLASVTVPDNAPSDYRNKIQLANKAEKQTLGYQMSVRVYRASAFTSSVTLPYEDGAASAVSNTGLSSRYTDEGEEKERPLYKGSVEIGPTNDSFNNLRDRLKKPE